MFTVLGTGIGTSINVRERWGTSINNWRKRGNRGRLITTTSGEK
jgi:hypothetical protein